MIPAAKLVTLMGAKAVLTFCLAGTAGVFALLPPVIRRRGPCRRFFAASSGPHGRHNFILRSSMPNRPPRVTHCPADRKIKLHRPMGVLPKSLYTRMG